MTDTFAISPAVLEWVCRTISLTALPARQRERLFEWRAGQSSPTFEELVEFSENAHLPPGYLFLKHPPEEKLPFKKDGTDEQMDSPDPSRDLIDTYYWMRSLQDWMIDCLEENEEEEPIFPGLFLACPNPDAAAEYWRKLLEPDPGWSLQEIDEETFQRLKNAVSHAGVLVMEAGTVRADSTRILNPEEFRGFALFDRKAPLIFINARDSMAGKAGTLIREFRQILQGKNDLYSGDESRRRREEGLTSATAAEDKPGQPEFDSRFLLALSQSVEAGTTSYTEAFRLTDMTEAAFRAAAEKAAWEVIGN